MPSQSLIVLAGGNDAEERQSDTNFASGGTAVRAHSNTVASSRYTAAFWIELTAAIVSGSAITQADVTINLDSTANDDPNLDIAVEDVADSVDFTTNPDIVNRTPTTAKTPWVATGLGTGDQTQSIISAVQELVDTYGGLASGAAIMVLFIGRSDANFQLRFTTYETSSSTCPRLVLAWTEPSGDLSVSESEAITISEAQALAVSDPQVSKSEAVAVSEALKMDLTIQIAVSEAITITDAATLAPVTETNISVSEAVTVSEAQDLDLTIEIAKAEAITITDAASVSIAAGVGTLEVNVSDSVTVSEAIATTVSDPQIGLSDSITVSESFTRMLESYISVADAVSVSESASLNLGDLNISVQDAIVVAELIAIAGAGVAATPIIIDLQYRSTTIALQSRSLEIDLPERDVIIRLPRREPPDSRD